MLVSQFHKRVAVKLTRLSQRALIELMTLAAAAAVDIDLKEGPVSFKGKTLPSFCQGVFHAT